MPPTRGFTRNLAVVISVANYVNGIPSLHTAVSAAATLAGSLEAACPCARFRLKNSDS